MPTYSISVRLQRTVVEDVHVSVPVTDEMIRERPEGGHGLDAEKVFAEAVRLGREADLAWRLEGDPDVALHPLQTPPPGVGER